jgi:uncharacterized protein with HEPN domain
MSPRNDEDRLRDMLEAARKAVATIQGRTRQDLDRDDVLGAALERFVEIVGEAATHVSDDRQRALPDIPWPQIMGMRNRLIHAYMTVNYDILWKTVNEDLPLLIEALEAALSE